MKNLYLFNNCLEDFGVFFSSDIEIKTEKELLGELEMSCENLYWLWKKLKKEWKVVGLQIQDHENIILVEVKKVTNCLG